MSNISVKIVATLDLGRSTLNPPPKLDLGSPNQHTNYDNYTYNHSFEHTSTTIIVRFI